MKGRKTGGRRKGTANRASIARAAAIAASGLTPLDYMLSVMRDEEADAKRRDAMASAVAPYVHPRLSTTELTGKDGEGLTIILGRHGKD